MGEEFIITRRKPKQEESVKSMGRRRLKVDRDTEVVIRNATNGIFFYEDPKTYNRYRMNNFGDEEYITVGELMTMQNRNRSFLENMWIVIVDVLDDEYTLSDVISFLRLDEVYASGLEPTVIDEFILNSRPSVFEDVISATETMLAKRVSERAIGLYREGVLKDKNKMYAIGSILKDTDLVAELDGAE